MISSCQYCAELSGYNLRDYGVVAKLEGPVLKREGTHHVQIGHMIC